MYTLESNSPVSLKEGFMKELNIIGFGRYYLFEQKTCSIGFWDVAHGEMFLNGKGIVFEADGNIDQGLFSFSLQPEQIQEITDFRQNEFI